MLRISSGAVFIRGVKKVVRKIFFDDIGLVATADNKVINAVRGVHFHDVPQNRHTTNAHHGLWGQISFFAEPSTKAAREDHCFHKRLCANAIKMALRTIGGYLIILRCASIW